MSRAVGFLVRNYILCNLYIALFTNDQGFSTERTSQEVTKLTTNADAMDDLALDRQLCFPLYAASNLIARLYRPVLGPLGLTYPQYLVMLVLWENSPQSIGGLGEKLHLDSGTLTPLVKRLVAGGFVSRSRDPADDRRVLVSLTEKGRALRTAAASIPQSLVHGLAITSGELEHLRDEVQHLVRVLTAPDAETVPENRGLDGTDSPPR